MWRGCLSKFDIRGVKHIKPPFYAKLHHRGLNGSNPHLKRGEKSMLAVVTGASSGIGYELAAELAKRGYDLVVASAGERLTGAAENFRTFGNRVTEASVDLATPDGVEELWGQVEALGVPVDVACINAGVGRGRTVSGDRSGCGVEHGESELRAARFIWPSTSCGRWRRATRAGFCLPRRSRARWWRPGGGVCGDQGICAVVCAQPSL